MWVLLTENIWIDYKMDNYYLCFIPNLRQKCPTYSDQYIIAWWSLAITDPNNEIICYPS